MIGNLKYFAGVLILCVLFNSCVAGYRGDFTSTTVVKPLNINRAEGKWLIDEPILENIDASYEDKIIENYRKFFDKKISTLTTIHEFDNVPTLKYSLQKNIKTLALYKEKTQYDYLISTAMKIKVDDNMLTKDLFITISTYDLNAQTKISEKEYVCKDALTGLNDSPLPSNLKRFLHATIKDCIKDYCKDKNWNAVGSLGQ